MNKDKIKLRLIYNLCNHGIAVKGYPNSLIRRIINSEDILLEKIESVKADLIELEFEDGTRGIEFVNLFNQLFDE